jgi:hypothetical protein
MACRFVCCCFVFQRILSSVAVTEVRVLEVRGDGGLTSDHAREQHRGCQRPRNAVLLQAGNLLNQLKNQYQPSIFGLIHIYMRNLFGKIGRIVSSDF